MVLIYFLNILCNILLYFLIYIVRLVLFVWCDNIFLFFFLKYLCFWYCGIVSEFFFIVLFIIDFGRFLIGYFVNVVLLNELVII